MKISLSKIDVAESQLRTAIRLMFGSGDPVSVHTLTSAALNILHDHIPKEEAWKHDIFLHGNTIFIKEEYQSIWRNKVREAANFFKHADRDLKAGRDTLVFNTTITEFHILEALNCLRIILKEEATWRPEYAVFSGWFMLKHPACTNEALKPLVDQFSDFPLDDLSLFSEVISRLDHDPSILERNYEHR